MQDNDSLTEDKSPYPQHSVMYYLSEKGFDLFATPTSEQDKVAQNALDDGNILFSSPFFSIAFYLLRH